MNKHIIKQHIVEEYFGNLNEMTAARYLQLQYQLEKRVKEIIYTLLERSGFGTPEDHVNMNYIEFSKNTDKVYYDLVCAYDSTLPIEKIKYKYRTSFPLFWLSSENYILEYDKD